MYYVLLILVIYQFGVDLYSVLFTKDIVLMIVDLKGATIMHKTSDSDYTNNYKCRGLVDNKSTLNEVNLVLAVIRVFYFFIICFLTLCLLFYPVLILPVCTAAIIMTSYTSLNSKLIGKYVKVKWSLDASYLNNPVEIFEGTLDQEFADEQLEAAVETLANEQLLLRRLIKRTRIATVCLTIVWGTTIVILSSLVPWS